MSNTIPDRRTPAADRSPPVPPAGRDVRGFLLVARVFLVIAVFFGLLLGAFFELWRQVDRLLDSDAWHGMTAVWRGALLALIAVIVLRIAWRLAFVILGLVTPKYEDWPGEHRPVPLDPEQNALLYETVADVCRAMQAPRPDEARISPVPECYVLEERRFGLRPQRRLVLVLGLPELLVMTVPEVRMIIAHEMVHFRGGDTTVIVFLFRFLESLRRAIEPISRRWWRWADPIDWLFAGFYWLVSRYAQPIQWRQELTADALSARVYGSNLAVRTLLKDWSLQDQFAETVTAYERAVGSGQLARQVNVFRYFVDRWRDLSSDGLQYLEERLRESEPRPLAGQRPTIGHRIELLRSFPAQPELPAHPAHDLIGCLPLLEDRLHAELTAPSGNGGVTPPAGAVG